jgi:hypothetical protein
MATNKFMERKIEAEVLSEVYEELENKLKYAGMSFEKVGVETEQARNYSTGELLWEDEEKTIPKYRDKYGYVPVSEEELTEEQKIKIRVIKKLMAKIENL